ncbi:hypothetical protein LINPERPRIM_LOCUS4700 [Linum perenne]
MRIRRFRVNRQVEVPNQLVEPNDSTDDLGVGWQQGRRWLGSRPSRSLVVKGLGPFG